MNNLILLFFAALTEVGVFTKEEGEALTKEALSATLPDNFEASYQMVHKLFDRLEVHKQLAHVKEEDLEKLVNEKVANKSKAKVTDYRVQVKTAPKVENISLASL